MPRPSHKFEIGQRIGTWMVESCAGTEKNRHNGHVHWNCVCDCGVRRTIPAADLQRKTTSSCSRCRAWLVKWDSALNDILRSYKKAAIARKLEWNISKLYANDLFKSACFYCGSAPQSIRRYGAQDSLEYIHGGIDRIDSSKGYTVDNTIPCCTKCNYAKNAMSVADFCKWIYTVYDHLMTTKWGEKLYDEFK